MNEPLDYSRPSPAPPPKPLRVARLLSQLIALAVVVFRALHALPAPL